MEKQIVLAAINGVVVSVFVGLYVLYRNYTRYAKRKDFEEVSDGMSAGELAQFTADQESKEATARTAQRRRMGFYVSIGIAIAVYLAVAA